ncbi:hypothetical protein IRJ41_005987 [Triplophysa rosa]|uniref:Uncharacterized protein n=1 Tax=Triplophysa rosa TaxID=992332 RepID=A0A9W7WQF0_TRIRA|nr:hypothetical protein IRJ41_005987 [Triplophysa rosa]
MRRGGGLESVNAVCTAVLWNYCYEHCEGLETEAEAKKEISEGGKESLHSLLILDGQDRVSARGGNAGGEEEAHWRDFTPSSHLQFLSARCSKQAPFRMAPQSGDCVNLRRTILTQGS